MFYFKITDANNAMTRIVTLLRVDFNINRKFTSLHMPLSRDHKLVESFVSIASRGDEGSFDLPVLKPELTQLVQSLKKLACQLFFSFVEEKRFLRVNYAVAFLREERDGA